MDLRLSYTEGTICALNTRHSIYEPYLARECDGELICRHVETILCSRLRKGPVLDPYKRRIMEMPDGGSVALDFEDLELCQDLPSDAPVVILLPGKGLPSAVIVRLSGLSLCPPSHCCTGSGGI